MGDPHLEDVFDAWLRRRSSGEPGAGLVGLYQMAAARRGISAAELDDAVRAELTALALPAMEPGFEIVAGSDRTETDPIELVPYDTGWPLQFATWQARLLEVLSSPPRRIEHIGSTAVPGLAAKPVIDIQVSVDDVGDEAAYVSAIESLGVQLRSRDAVHRFFRPFSGRPRDVQIHVCNSGSDWERRHLAFRDLLRNSSDARTQYLAAKRAAAQRWRHDRIAYADAKSEVIDRLTRS